MNANKVLEDLTFFNAMQNPESTILKFKQTVEGRKIVIYGAALIGTVLHNCLHTLELDVYHIVDRDAKQIKEVNGFIVETPNILHGLVDSANEIIIILAVSERTAKNVNEDLVKISSSFEVLMNGEKITDCLQIAICAANHNRGEDISHAVCGDCSVLDNICPILHKRGEDMLGCNTNAPDATKTTDVTMIGYILGNVCTLNCNHCCESVPLFPIDKRGFVDTDTVIKDIKRLAEVSKFITIAEFIGGEPFLHPGLSKIIKSTLEIENIAYIRIFTNGTIVPPDELIEALFNPRVAVYISNYSKMMTDAMLVKVTKTKKILEENGVSFIFGGDKKWFNFSSYDFHSDSDEELRRRFNACFLHNCNRLHEGTLYVCPHHYAGLNLGLLSNRDEIIKIHELPDVELVKALIRFKEVEFIDACRNCNMPFNAPIILPGAPAGDEKHNNKNINNANSILY